jgi:hypothetical protein
MIDPMTAMMAVNLGLTGAQAIYGGVQANKANKELEKLQAPQYKVQPEAYKQLGISQTLASNRNMPGQQDMIEMIDRGLGNTVTQINRSGGSTADRLAAIGATYAEGTNQKNQINLQAGQQYLQNLQGLQGAYGNMLVEKDKVFANQQQNYMQKLQSLQGMKAAGSQNLAAGIQGSAGVVNQQLSFNDQSQQNAAAYAQELEKLKIIYGIPKTNP